MASARVGTEAKRSSLTSRSWSGQGSLDPALACGDDMDELYPQLLGGPLELGRSLLALEELILRRVANRLISAVFINV